MMQLADFARSTTLRCKHGAEEAGNHRRGNTCCRTYCSTMTTTADSATGIPKRSYTKLSHLTKEEKLEHRRQQRRGYTGVKKPQANLPKDRTRPKVDLSNFTEESKRIRHNIQQKQSAANLKQLKMSTNTTTNNNNNDEPFQSPPPDQVHGTDDVWLRKQIHELQTTNKKIEARGDAWKSSNDEKFAKILEKQDRLQKKREENIEARKQEIDEERKKRERELEEERKKRDDERKKREQELADLQRMREEEISVGKSELEELKDIANDDKRTWDEELKERRSASKQMFELLKTASTMKRNPNPGDTNSETKRRQHLLIQTQHKPLADTLVVADSSSPAAASGTSDSSKVQPSSTMDTMESDSNTVDEIVAATASTVTREPKSSKTKLSGGSDGTGGDSTSSPPAANLSTGSVGDAGDAVLSLATSKPKSILLASPKPPEQKSLLSKIFGRVSFGKSSRVSFGKSQVKEFVTSPSERQRKRHEFQRYMVVTDAAICDEWKGKSDKEFVKDFTDDVVDSMSEDIVKQTLHVAHRSYLLGSLNYDTLRKATKKAFPDIKRLPKKDSGKCLSKVRELLEADHRENDDLRVDDPVTTVEKQAKGWIDKAMSLSSSESEVSEGPEGTNEPEASEGPEGTNEPEAASDAMATAVV